MAPVIRVDDEVWSWLKSLARPLEDTPNSVLRRVANLSGGAGATPRSAEENDSELSDRGSRLLREFKNALEKAIAAHGGSHRPWERMPRRSANVVEVRLVEHSRLLYIKTRSESGGFWGLRQGIIESLESSQLSWDVVLLLGPAEKGYLLSAVDVRQAIKKHRWSFGKAGDFKVHEGAELTGARDFDSHRELIASILGA